MHLSVYCWETGRVNTTGATSGTGTAYPSGAPEFTTGFLWGSCYSIFSFICMFCRSLFVLLYFFFWPLCCLFFFNIQILITPMVSSPGLDIIVCLIPVKTDVGQVDLVLSISYGCPTGQVKTSEIPKRAGTTDKSISIGIKYWVCCIKEPCFISNLSITYFD